MENRDKIKNEILETKDLLLKTHTELKSSQKEVYDLEKEFKKTRKNKNILYYFVIILFIGIIIATTILLIKYINKNTQKIDLKDEKFQDLVLKDIINTADETEGQIKLLQNELDDLVSARNSEIEKVKFNAKKQIEFTKEKKGLFKEQKNKLIKELTDSQNLKISSIYKRYSALIKTKENEIKDLKVKNDSIKKQINSQQNIDTVIDDKRIQTLKTNNIYKYYDNKIKSIKTDSDSKSKELEGYYLELLNLTQQKYDPVFTTDEIKDLNIIDIRENVKIEMNIQSVFDKYGDYLLSGNLLTHQKMTDMVNHEKVRETISYLFDQIPYNNSMITVLKYRNFSEKDSINLYNNLLSKILNNSQNLTDEVNRQKKSISDLENFIYAAAQSSVKTDKKLIGYAISSDNDEINAYMFKSFIPKNGQKCYIIRANNVIIANLTFTGSEQNLKLSVINKTQNIAANDFIYAD